MSECWEESLCFWMVPVGTFLGLVALGCVCGICCGYMDTEDDETEKLIKKKSVDNIGYEYELT